MTKILVQRLELNRIVMICCFFTMAVLFAPWAGAHCGACDASAAKACEASAAKACEAGSAQVYENSLVDVAKGAGDFKTLLKAAEAAGLAEALSTKGPFTVFAPTDAAFARLPQETLLELLLDRDKLRGVLMYHVVSGAVPSEKAIKLTSAPSLFGQDIPVEVERDAVTVGGAKVIATDINADNGVIHVIDEVLIPRDIVGVATDNENFTTLAAAIEAAGLVEVLQGTGPYTVFAPTDEAFSKLPEGTLETLLRPENRDQLRAILTYHVVPGTYMASDVVDLTEAQTAQGAMLPVKISEDEKIYVGDAHVIGADVAAFNGVIHVIDTVMLPVG